MNTVEAKNGFELNPGMVAMVGSIVSVAVKAVGEKFGEGRTGGYFYLADPDCRLILHMRAGTPNKEKLGVYRRLSQEKAERLCFHPEHNSSFQSRDPDQKKFAGAIRLSNGLILSFSGLPELVDEAFMAAIARHMKWESEEEILARLKPSRNVALYKQVYSVVTDVANGRT